MKGLKIVLVGILFGLGCLLSGCGEMEAKKHFRQGYEYSQQGKLEEAIAEFQQVIQINPNKLLGNFLLGDSYRRQGKLDDAITKYQQTLQIDSNYAMAHLGLGYIYHIQGKYEQSVAKYQHVIDLLPDKVYGNPTIAYAHSNLADIYRRQGKVEEALEKLRQAMQIEIDPDIAPAWVNECQGMIYLIQGKLDEALSESQQVVKVNPKEGYAHYSLACVYSLKNEPKLAIESLQKAFDLDKSLIESSKTDPDFDNIRQTPEYQQLINSY